MGITDYYLYLLKISWPALSGLFAVYLFLGLRLLMAAKKQQNFHSCKNRILFGLRVTVTIAVLMIYTRMFAGNYGDWFSQPSFCRGIVAGLLEEMETGQDKYFVTVEDGEELLKLKIDHYTFSRLYEDDFVQLAYLPVKKEVFYCSVLTRQVAPAYDRQMVGNL
jgi:hypothetical protein